MSDPTKEQIAELREDYETNGNLSADQMRAIFAYIQSLEDHLDDLKHDAWERDLLA